MLKRAVLLIVALLALAALYLWLALQWSFSSGERAGWVQKLSSKGWVCKTWEGELAVLSVPGTQPEKFTFTIRDDAVAERVTRAMGKRVALHYEEKVGLPGSCFGDTRYFITGVTISDEIPLGPGVVMTTPSVVMPTPGVVMPTPGAAAANPPAVATVPPALPAPGPAASR